MQTSLAQATIAFLALPMVPPKRASIKCFGCLAICTRDKFSYSQLHQGKPKCLACTTTHGFAVCSECKVSHPIAAYSHRQQQARSQRQCPDCTSSAAQRSGATRQHGPALSSGQQAVMVDCLFCGLKLLPSESTHFCCQSGQHAMNFSAYFPLPGDALVKL